MKICLFLLSLSFMSFGQDALLSLDSKQVFDVNECGENDSHFVCKPFYVSDENGNSIMTYRRIFTCFAYGEAVYNTSRSEASKFYSSKRKCLTSLK